MFLSGDLARHRSADPNDRKSTSEYAETVPAVGRSRPSLPPAAVRPLSAFDFPPRPVIRVRYRCGNNQKTPIFHEQANNRLRIGRQMTVKETVRNDPVKRIIRSGRVGKGMRVVTINRILTTAPAHTPQTRGLRRSTRPSGGASTWAAYPIGVRSGKISDSLARCPFPTFLEPPQTDRWRYGVPRKWLLTTRTPTAPRLHRTDPPKPRRSPSRPVACCRRCVRACPRRDGR